MLNQCLTVGQLRQALAKYEDETAVVILSPYGNRGNTIQALPAEDVSLVSIAKGSYSESGYIVAEPEEDDPDEENVYTCHTVLAIHRMGEV